MGHCLELKQQIIDGMRVSYEQALAIVRNYELESLCALADGLRSAFMGDRVDTCSIMNARSGRCEEDCKWCAQSKYYQTEIDTYPLIDEEQALCEALRFEREGIGRFSLVTSGRAMSDPQIERCCQIVERIGGESKIALCASMGLLNRDQLKRLYKSGIRRYHCNLETAPSMFGRLCTTHTIEQKIETIKAAQSIGMEVCSGGIIGMGESMEQRVELAVKLRELGVRSIPINILNPIAGTPLESCERLSDDEILASFAIFRVVNPEADIRFAGGRVLIAHLQRRLLRAGVSASIMGDMLTTLGVDIESDKQMFRSEGFTI